MIIFKLNASLKYFQCSIASYGIQSIVFIEKMIIRVKMVHYYYTTIVEWEGIGKMADASHRRHLLVEQLTKFFKRAVAGACKFLHSTNSDTGLNGFNLKFYSFYFKKIN